ncbi:MAG: hypothetical protein ACRDP1_07000 [Nocardioidaceae bacterium]
MLPVVITVLVIVVLAAVVVTYVAFAQRGKEIPKAPGLSAKMSKAAESMGLEEDGEDHIRVVAERHAADGPDPTEPAPS